MATCTPNELSAMLRKGDLCGAYYIYGEDIALIQKLTEDLLRKATKGASASVKKFDGTALQLDALRDAARQTSLFTQKNCIWVHDLNADNLRENALKQVLEILRDLPPETILVFDVTGGDPKNGRKYPQGKNRTLIETIAKNGIVCEAQNPTERELCQEMMTLAKKQGCMLPWDAAMELVRLCAGHTMILHSELDKVVSFVGEGEITIDMVREITTPQLEATGFDLANAVTHRNAKGAFQTLEKLFAMQADRTSIVHAVATSLQDLYRAAAAIAAGVPARQMREDFGYAYDFRVKIAFRDGRRLPLAGLRECMQILRDLEQALNSTGGNERGKLEVAIAQMMEAMLAQ